MIDSVKDVLKHARDKGTKFTAVDLVQDILSNDTVLNVIVSRGVDPADLIASVSSMAEASVIGAQTRAEIARVSPALRKMLGLLGIRVPGAIVDNCTDLALEFLNQAPNPRIAADLNRNLSTNTMDSLQTTNSLNAFSAFVIRKIGEKSGLAGAPICAEELESLSGK